MAALCPGVQYGLSSQENFGENKTLVFVKLTDSAYRAIEEHLKLQKQNKHFSRTPTIKFLGNEGQFSFSSAPPSTGNTAGSNNGITPPASAATTTFNFSLSSTADMEGPGGSFECVQHRQQLPAAAGGARSGGGGTTLAVLGPIAHKMRVHATDDVYEETRKRMTVADKIQKNKCTQEIKPNQTDIGRKVKVRQHHSQQQSSSSSQSAAVNTSSSRSGNISGGSGGSSSFSRISNSMRRNDPPSSSSTANVPAICMSSSSSAAAAISSSSMPNNVVNNSSNPSPLKSGSPYSPSLNPGLYSSGNNGLLDRISAGGNMSINSSMPQRPNGQQGLHSNHVSSSRPPKQSISNISRRPLRERLIHLLALRPFKKIEIHERLIKEGLREKNLIQTVLKHVSTLKDNCYYLNRVMWNDVQEEWPFYTEQEKQVLKRRKPQNLTPPGGSDGGSSTGSGNSPTSTHPGSPPSTTTTTMSSSGRHRVSHLSNPQQHGSYNHQQITHRQQQTTQQQQSLQSGTLLDSGKRQQHQQNLPPVDRRDASDMNPRSRQQEQQQQQGGAAYGMSAVYGGIKRQLSEDDEEMGEDEGSRKRHCDSHILSFGVNRDPKPWSSSQSDSTTTLPLQNSTSPSKPSCPQLQQQQTKQSLSNSSAFDSTRTNISNISSQRTTTTTSTSKQQHQEQPIDDYNSSTTWWSNNANNSKGGTSAQGPKQRKEAARVSPDSQSDRIDSMQRQQQGERSPPAETDSEKWPGAGGDDDEYDYVREYTTIKDLEQRRRYKNDFNAVYDEYKKLHGVVEAVSHRFQILDERLKRESVVNTPKYNEIKEQIMREYMLTKKDQHHQRNKRRFEYLHRKLSHIKDVVSQFDQHIQRDETMAPAPQYTSAAATSTY